MNTRNNEFESIWWEMEELEPLTPFTSHNYYEIPLAVRQTEEKGLCDPEIDIL